MSAAPAGSGARSAVRETTALRDDVGPSDPDTWTRSPDDSGSG